MSKLTTFFKLLFNDRKAFNRAIAYNLQKSWLSTCLPDKTYLSLIYKLNLDNKINWDNPKTFNEKLQWLKLYDRRPEYTTMVDKHAVKEYVTNIIGEEYIIPTLGVWERFDDIDFDSLPEKFVLKCTHDSGSTIICKNKSSFDIQTAKIKLTKALKKNLFSYAREWPYKNVQPRIIAEAYMEDPSTKELRDYKFFCFDGVAKMMFIATDRYTEGVETKFDFFDIDFNHLDFTNGHPNADVLPKKPENFEKMIELAEKLSQGIPHCRVDFYEVDGKIYFGEITFFHWSGMVAFDPPEWDEKIGSWITLPKPYMNC